MISNRDLNEELVKIDKILAESTDPIEIAKAQLKATSLNIKLLSNLRTNSVSMMRHLKVPMKTVEERNNEK